MATVIPLRVVKLPWTCHQTGDCCRAVSEVTMTVEESEVIKQHIDPVLWLSLRWRPAGLQATGNFVALQANPCPLLREAGGKALCSIHAHRPYNCRRFGCFRPDPATEPFEPDHDQLGCGNVRDRIQQNRDVRRAAQLMQRKAMRWARAHGWREP